MKRLKKRLSILLVLALVLASLALDFGQLNAFAYDNHVGTGLVRVSIQIGSNDCGDNARGTDSSFRLQFIDANDTVVGATPDNAIEGRPEESAYGDPLEAGQTTTFGSTAGAGGNVEFITASLGTIAVNKSINRVQLVNTYWEDNWNFNNVIFYYSHDGGTNWTQIASGGWSSGSEGAVGTWNVSYFDTNYKTLTFHPNNGTGGGQYDAIPGQTITQPAAPVRAGYTFISWAGAPARMPNASVTYFAAWSVNSYTITFNANGGSSVASITNNFGTTVTPPANPTRTGYAFAGWLPAVPPTIPAENTTCVAQWTLNTYTITFDSNGGTAVSPIAQEYGTEVTAPANPERTGYTFAGWLPAVPTVMPANNTTCVAQWTLNTYTITFDANGGTAVAPLTQSYGSAVVSPVNIARTGYTFAGWLPAVPATMPAENLTCVAQWTINDYTITFNANGGTATAPITQEYGSSVAAPANPTRAGYTFTGWAPAMPASMPAENLTCVAQWSVNSYTITFDANGGSAVAPITQNYGTAVTAPADPVRAGYTFEGWLPLVPDAMPAGDITCVAQWSINSYTITFDTGGGSIIPAVTQVYGSAITEPVIPTRAGYAFAGWQPVVPSVMPAGDLTCVAQWVIPYYTIIWDANGGSGGGQNSCRSGEDPEPIDPGTKLGYLFAGWSPMIMPATGDTVYTAQWTVNSYTITFDSAGGSVVAPITQNFGTDVIPPDSPVREGYTFLGWLPEVPATMPAGNTTCTAQWMINGYTIVFNANGGIGGTEQLLPYGAIPVPPEVTKENYTFNGWAPAVEPVTGNAVYTAQWLVNTVTVTFDANGGDGSAELTVNYGQVPVPPVVTRLNYRFAGWSPELIAATEDATYTAQWIMLGDINASGGISSLDALMVLQYVAGVSGLTELQLLQADVDMNGIVNNIDALKILQFASGTINSFQ
jgi:hypothetical protein